MARVARLSLTVLRTVGKILLAFIGAVLLILVIAGVRVGYDNAQRRQVWALQVVAAGGDPVELARFSSWDECESRRAAAGRENYHRGVAVGLKCQGVRSLWERLK